MERRRFLFRTLGVLAAPALYAAGIERWRIEITHHRIPLPRLPQPLRLVQLSDLHHSPLVSLDYLAHVAELALAQQPDLICLTGDYVDAPHLTHDPAYPEFFRSLSRRVPTFAVLGNHDGGKWFERRFPSHDPRPIERVLSQGEVHLLQNSSTQFAGLHLAGLADLWSGYFHARPAFESMPSATPTIVLAHNPDSKAALAPYPWDLLLAGHTHGNQIRLPFIDSNQWAVVRDTRFIAGLYRWQGRHLHVNRGIGGFHGIRFNCRPEISVLHLIPA